MSLYFSDLGNKSKIQQAIGYINESLEQISKHEAELNKAVFNADKTPMTVQHANVMKGLRYVNDYKTLEFDGKEVKGKYGWYSKENTVSQTCAIAKSHADYLISECKRIHELNTEAIPNNKAVVDNIKAIMSKIGIASTYKTYDNKGRNGRYVQKTQERTHTAGYIEDLTRCIKVDDGFSVAESTYKTFIESIEKYKNEHLKKEQDAIAKKEAEEQKIRDDKELATLVVKYKIDYQSTWRDVLETIVEKDKYLELAYWLERQRNSWADGFWKARDAINSFKVETPLDELIYAEISSLAEDCDDGRVFRDCEYNYSALYGMVTDEDLLSDFRLVFDKIASDLD